MNPEEKPPREPESDSHTNPDGDVRDSASVPSSTPAVVPVEASLADSQSIEPEIVESEIVDSGGRSTSMAYAYTNPAVVADKKYLLTSAPALSSHFENLAAKGGAVGALVLGIWCLAGSFITNWSIINGLIGLTMGLWGLSSRNKKMAWIGIALCIIGIFLSLVQVSEIINVYLNAREEI